MRLPLALAVLPWRAPASPVPASPAPASPVLASVPSRQASSAPATR